MKNASFFIGWPSYVLGKQKNPTQTYLGWEKSERDQKIIFKIGDANLLGPLHISWLLVGENSMVENSGQLSQLQL